MSCRRWKNTMRPVIVLGAGLGLTLATLQLAACSGFARQRTVRSPPRKLLVHWVPRG